MVSNLKMKISICCGAAHYLIAAFTVIQQIEAIPRQLPILEPGGDDSLSYSIVPEVVVLKLSFLVIHINEK